MKITKSHSSATESTKKIITILKKSYLVSKISLGIINKTRSKDGNISIKHSDITGGIKVTVVGGGTAQEIYVYTKEIIKTRDLLNKV